jgi:hypothetical protein
VANTRPVPNELSPIALCALISPATFSAILRTPVGLSMPSNGALNANASISTPQADPSCMWQSSGSGDPQYFGSGNNILVEARFDLGSYLKHEISANCSGPGADVPSAQKFAPPGGCF